ncbi:560_t:CDS:2, partial [Racocetra fulgida]
MQLYGLTFTEGGYPKSVLLRNVSVEADSKTYKNVEKNTIEAIYKFPLHEAAAVCAFEAEIDGKKK